MKKFRNLYIAILFLMFIFSGFAGVLLLPKSEVSPLEKRTLTKAPELSVGAVLNGRFEKQAEGFVSDHFPFRALWASADSYARLCTGLNGVDGIYKGKDAYLLPIPVKPDYEALDANLEAMLSFSEGLDIPSALMLVPSSGFILSDKLPQNHLDYPDDELLDYSYSKTESVIGRLDLRERFNECRDEVPLYYRTDHHWTTAGAYEAYLEYCRNVGFEDVLWDFNVKRYDGFFGTSYSKSALWLEKGDVLEVWDYPAELSCVVDGEEYPYIYFSKHLSSLDKYSVFLDGNHDFERVINRSKPDGGRLLIIKDSYAHALIPFLINHYGEIDCVDLRYYLEPVSELCERNEYERVLYVFGMSSICEGRDISILE